MRKGIFILLMVIVASMAMMTTGCSKKGEGNDSIKDSVQTDTVQRDTSHLSLTDSLVKATPMPKQADELFDDFFFNFYINDKLQLARITFPLTITNDEQTLTVNREDWKMDHFFRYEEFYSVIGSTAKSLRCAGDTTIKHVTVENMMFHDGNVRQYVFNRVGGKWMMQQINNISMDKHPDAQFMQFFYKFATDDSYQHQCLSPKMTYVGPDANDEVYNVTRTINSSDWDDVIHALPDNFEQHVDNTGMFSIVYGDRKAASTQRVISFRGIANGDEIRYTFKKTAGGWKLVKYEM